MIQRERYEKPVLVDRRLVASEAIAEKCWSPAHDDEWGGYYNDPGFGGVKFRMLSTGNNCSNNFTVLAYYNNANEVITAGEYVAHHTDEGYTVDNVVDKLHAEISVYLTGNDGTNFHANPPMVTEDPPVDKWSI